MRGILNKPDLKKFLFFTFVLIPIFILCYTGAVGGSFGMSSISLFIMIAAMLPLSIIEISIYNIRTKRPNFTLREVELLEEIYSVSIPSGLQSKELAYNSEITLNVGGFILPLVVSIYLIAINLKIEILMILLMMLIVTHLLSRIRGGVGVVVPDYIGLLAIPLCFVLIENNPAPVMFIVGVLGVLLGVCTKLMTIEGEEGSGFFNIGGAGSFNPIYITIILSVLFSII